MAVFGSPSKLFFCILLAFSVVLSGCGGDESSLVSEGEEVSLDDSSEIGDDLPEEPEIEDPIEEDPHSLSLVSAPDDATIFDGQTHTFSVVVSHSHPITVTWTRNGAVIQTSSSTSLSVSSAGTYSCSISDGELLVGCGSFELSVDVLQFVTITSQAGNQMINEGLDASFEVEAVGSGALSYQWYFNGAALSGENASELNLNNVTTGDSGTYYCVVSTGGVSQTTSSASLSVVETPDGRALISWSRPLAREDDSELEENEISEYEIYYSATESGEMTALDSVTASNLSYTAEGLTEGAHYFALKTVDADGVKSQFSEVIAVVID